MVICPNCETEFDKQDIIIEKVKKGLIHEDHWIYSCPKCKKILGLSQQSV